MSSEDLAERMNVVGSRVRRLEADEVKNKVTLSTLERAAKAMDCRFVYMFIPNGSFEEIVERRAIELARHRVSKTSRNMALEDQRVDSKVLSDLEKDLTNEYLVDPPRDFWSRKI
jgi:predicted DNA-binding mobile mystery protein A